jgi:hypothetical protein
MKQDKTHLYYLIFLIIFQNEIVAMSKRLIYET